MATPSAPICAAQERPVFPFQPLPTSSHDVLWSFDNIAEVLSEEVEVRKQTLEAITQYFSATDFGGGIVDSSGGPAVSTQGLLAFLGWHVGAADTGEGLTWAALRRHDGVSEPTIYLSVRSTVYDVSTGSSFYGPGSGYSVLAGHDGTRSLSTMSLDAHDLDEPWYTPADEEENQALEGWEKKFQEKYPIVGPLRQHTLVDRVCKQVLRSVLHAETDVTVQGSRVAAHPADALALVFGSSTLLAPHMFRKDPRTAGLEPLIAAGAAAIEQITLTRSQTAGNLESDATFLECEAYDFNGDAMFQSGKDVVLAKIQQRDMLSRGKWDPTSALVEAQAFYYSKCIKPMDVPAFVRWAQLRAAEEKSVADTTESAEAHSSESAQDAPPVKLSFDEVMALVAAGKEVPGCRKVDVEVQVDVEPSKSVLSRPPKPWESAESDGGAP